MLLFFVFLFLCCSIHVYITHPSLHPISTSIFLFSLLIVFSALLFLSFLFAKSACIILILRFWLFGWLAHGAFLLLIVQPCPPPYFFLFFSGRIDLIPDLFLWIQLLPPASLHLPSFFRWFKLLIQFARSRRSFSPVLTDLNCPVMSRLVRAFSSSRRMHASNRPYVLFHIEEQ